MTIIIPVLQEKHKIEFDGRKFISSTIKLKELKQAINADIIVLGEDGKTFANVFSSSEGGYCIYWYNIDFLDAFILNYWTGDKVFEEIDGAHCKGSLRDALEWAYQND